MKCILFVLVVSLCASISYAAPSTRLLVGQSNARELANTMGAQFTATTELHLADLAPWQLLIQGGQAIDSWDPGTVGGLALDHAALTATSLVFWQGERDAMDCRPHYATDLRALLARVRSSRQQAIPIVVGQIGYLNESTWTQIMTSLDLSSPYSCFTAIRAAIEEVGHDAGNLFIDTSDLALIPLNFHFTPDSYRLMLARVAAALGPDLSPATGQVMAWKMGSGFAVVASAVLATVSPEWHIEAVGDLDGDHKADLIWHNNLTGQNVWWQMDGLTIHAAGWLPTLPDPHWHIVGLADLDGDGQLDVILRNQ